MANVFPKTLTKDDLQIAYGIMRNQKAHNVMQFQAELPSIDWMNQQRCPTCKKKMVGTVIRDQASFTELTISGCCQGCQDEAFPPHLG